MSAVLSPCRRYRYRLDRNVDLFGRMTLGFCLHNPSTADETADDPTLRRCLGFAKSLGAGRLVIVNPWAGRATKPADLWAMDDPVGPENDPAIADAAEEVAASGGFIIVGWGTIKPPAGRHAAALERLLATEELIREAGCHLQALACNSDRSPQHPLYVAAVQRPMAWTGLTLERALAKAGPYRPTNSRGVVPHDYR